MAFPPGAPSPLNPQQSSDWSHPTTLQSWCCSENPQLSPGKCRRLVRKQMNAKLQVYHLHHQSWVSLRMKLHMIRMLNFCLLMKIFRYFQTLFANFYKLGRPVFAFFMMLFGPKPPFATDLELAVSSGAGNANISVLPSLLALAFRQRWNSFTRWGISGYWCWWFGFFPNAWFLSWFVELKQRHNAWFLSWFVEVKQRHGESHYSEISWDLWAKRLNRLARHGKATKNHPSISQHCYNLRLFVLLYRLVFSYCVQHQHCQEEEHQIMCNVYITLRYINNLYDNLINI